MGTINFIKYQYNNSKNQKAYHKWYGRLVTRETLQTNDLCKHIQKHGSIYTADVVKGVVEKFISCFEELLLEGNKVKLGGLGTFYLSASCEGAESESDFTAANFKAIRMKFLSDQSKESEYTARLLKGKAKLKEYANIEPAEPGSSSGGGGSDPGTVQPDGD